MKTEGQRQSQKHEKRLAKEVGGSTTAASGAFWSRKGDVRSDDLLIEHKYTGKKQYTLKSVELKKITREAILDGRMPVFGVHLDGINYVLLLEEDLLDLHRERQCTCPTTTGDAERSVPGLTPTSSTHLATRTSTSR